MIAKYMALPLLDKRLHGDPQARRQLSSRLPGTALARLNAGNRSTGQAGQLRQPFHIQISTGHRRRKVYPVNSHLVHLSNSFV